MEPLTVPGVLESLGTIRQYVREAARNAGINEDAAYDLTLAVEEFATNSMMHGYREHDMSGSVVVSAEETGDELIICIDDTAPEFDPRSLASPSEEELAKPLEERAIGGLGVYLSVRALDRFDYARVDGRNHLILGLNKATRS